MDMQICRCFRLKFLEDDPRIRDSCDVVTKPMEVLLLVLPIM